MLVVNGSCVETTQFESSLCHPCRLETTMTNGLRVMNDVSGGGDDGYDDVMLKLMPTHVQLVRLLNLLVLVFPSIALNVMNQLRMMILNDSMAFDTSKAQT